MKLESLDDLFEYIRSAGKRTLVAVNAVDSHSLEAIAEAVTLNMVSAIVTGNRDEIIKQCAAHQIDESRFQIIHAETEEDSARLYYRMRERG